MKKIVCLLMSLLLILSLPAALAIETGEYTWQNYTVQLVEIEEKPFFAPADMKEGERPLSIVLEAPKAVALDNALSHAMYKSACLMDESGRVYKPGVLMTKENTFTYLFAIPKELDSASLCLTFEGEAPASDALKAFVGDWEGQSGDIHLTFTVNEDGSGQYIFEQSGYRESYPVRLSADDHTFIVDIPSKNALSITDCRGVWQYEDEALKLDVVTTFANGRQFKFSIPCRRVEKKAVPEEYIGKWRGSSGNITLTFEIGADSRAKFTFQQGQYAESNEVALSVEDGTFQVEIPADDATTKSCGGSYSYENGVLTVSVRIVFKNGRDFAYTVPCKRVSE
ncbi:MAG: hypothetical protein ACOX6Y_12755 [Christensenellales bacterium]